MNKTMKFTLLVCLVFLVCALMFTSCDRSDEAQPPSNTSDESIIEDSTTGSVTNSTTEPETEAHVHVFGEWSVTKEATCTENGERERVCACGDKETQGVDRIPHTFGEWSIIKEATCTVKGEQERSCSCGEKEKQSVDMSEHIEVIDKAVAPTCTKAGLTEGKHCSVCNKIIAKQEEVPIIAHTYDDKYDENCNACGFKRDAECAHSETEIIKGKEATCSSTGLTNGTKCKKCGETITSQSVIPAKGHTEMIDKAVAATCTKAGKTEGKHCSVCNKILVAQTTINALGHTNSDWIIDSPATCMVAGERHKYCSACSLSYDNESYYESHNLSTSLTKSYWYYNGNDKTIWTQPYPFIAIICKNCNYGYWTGPTPTLKHYSTALLYDGIHYNFEAKASNYGVGDLKIRFIIADFDTAIEAAIQYEVHNTPYDFAYDSGWIDSERYLFDCLNFNPVASYDNPYLFVIAYDPATDTKQSYGAQISKDEWTTDDTWYYYELDISLGSRPNSKPMSSDEWKDAFNSFGRNDQSTIIIDINEKATEISDNEVYGYDVTVTADFKKKNAYMNGIYFWNDETEEIDECEPFEGDGRSFGEFVCTDWMEEFWHEIEDLSDIGYSLFSYDPESEAYYRCMDIDGVLCDVNIYFENGRIAKISIINVMDGDVALECNYTYTYK